MKKLITIVLMMFVFSTFYGCGNLSPRNEGKIGRINNKRGKIDGLQQEMKNLQGSINNELKVNAEKLDNLQEGMIVSRKDNTNQGVQILQGDGVLVLILSLAMLTTVAGMGVLYYKSKTEKAEKATQLLSDEIAMCNNPDLEDKIFIAAKHAGLQKEMLGIIAKSQKNLT